ncbi:hypothetical protein J2W40_002565 [Sphingobium xenophagum]|uniref:Uncharacterized protein n=1 Tax=Sphingobium xenophagum TaxID=121428 RepID=A0ABU1X2N8_SPHXE|nr:hypothetical protein [Sphingobium xenophagum]
MRAERQIRDSIVRVDVGATGFALAMEPGFRTLVCFAFERGRRPHYPPHGETTHAPVPEIMH